MKIVSGKRFGRLLEERGWELQRVTSRHHIYVKNGSYVRFSIPVSGDRPLKAGLQRQLMKTVYLLSQGAGSKEPQQEQVSDEISV